MIVGKPLVKTTAFPSGTSLVKVLLAKRVDVIFDINWCVNLNSRLLHRAQEVVPVGEAYPIAHYVVLNQTLEHKLKERIIMQLDSRLADDETRFRLEALPRKYGFE